jgi:RNA polymerase sigma-70 factor (ECF subfamily)
MGGVQAVQRRNSPDTPGQAGQDEAEKARRRHEREQERSWVEAARAGDTRAFEHLYRRHAGRIHALVWRLAGNDAALAEDLVQDAFIRAWDKLHLFEGKSAFGTWLHRLAANVALSDRRIRVRRVARELPMDDAVERTAVGERDLQVALRTDLEQAIATLPERARTVLVLFDIEGYRHEEISDLTGMAVGSSKAQLHRARKLVRAALDPPDGRAGASDSRPGPASKEPGSE